LNAAIEQKNDLNLSVQEGGIFIGDDDFVINGR
jgi:hypothetical protein